MSTSIPRSSALSSEAATKWPRPTQNTPSAATPSTRGDSSAQNGGAPDTHTIEKFPDGYFPDPPVLSTMMPDGPQNLLDAAIYRVLDHHERTGKWPTDDEAYGCEREVRA